MKPGRTIKAKRNIRASREEKYRYDVSIDNSAAEVAGSWTSIKSQEEFPGFKGGDFIYTSAEVNGIKRVKWSPKFINHGYYSVYVNLPDGPTNRDFECPYTIKHADGVFVALMDQRTRSKVAYLGTFRFDKTSDQYVEIDNKRSSTSIVINADAMTFVLEREIKQPDLKIRASVFSPTTNRIDIVGDAKGLPLYIDRISDGKSYKVEIMTGTKTYYDHYGYKASNAQITYRIGAIGRPGYAAESTVTRLDAVTVSADIQVTALGYKPGQRKTVIIKTDTGATRFSVLNALDGSTVQYMRNLDTVSDPMLATVLKGDFSEIKTPGNYRIKTDNGLLSTVFPIGNDIYEDFISASIRNLKISRWPAVKMVKREDTGQTIDIGGGWEDALDYKHWTSYNDTIQPFALMELIANAPNVPGAEGELRYGLSYLLRIQERNPNGSGVMKFGQLAAAYSDILSTDSTPYILRVENIDLNDLGGYNKRCEHVIAHYLYSLVLAKASKYFIKEKDYSDRLKTQAIDAFAYMDKYDELPRVKNAEFSTVKDYFRALPVINYAYKALAAFELYKLTGQTSYRDKSKQALAKVVQSQVRDHKKTAGKYTGFFLRDVGNAEIMRSRIHAGIPLYALSLLARELTEATEQEWFTWHQAAKTFVDGFIKRFIPKNAYNIIPYGFGIGSRKVDAADTMSYRFFQGSESDGAVYSDGNTKMVALYAAALYEYAITFSDKEAAEIADSQLEWIGGKNVFGTPKIVGFGDIKIDASKLFTHGYTANSYELVGAMVNGIDGSLSTDAPRWTNTWQTGETWGVNRSWMQFAVAQLTKLENWKKKKEDVYIESVKLSSEVIASGGSGTATVKIVNSSDLNRKVAVRLLADNASIDNPENIIRLKPGSVTDLALEVKGLVADKTLVIAAVLDGKRLSAKSVLGFVQ